MSPWTSTPLLLVACGLMGCACSTGAAPGATDADASVLVFAAVSLREALLEAESVFESSHDVEVEFSYAGSNVLAQQIEAAPVADVFFSASVELVEQLDAQGRIVAGSRRDVLSNDLQVIAHPDSGYQMAAAKDIVDLGAAFLSIGDPRAVPAGVYAKAFLERVQAGEGTAWDVLESRVAPAPSVRGAMGMVEQHPDVVGIVYRTDAQSSDRIRVLYTVPPEEAPQIRYSVALVQKASISPGSASWVRFLVSDAAERIFTKHGFGVAAQE